MQSGLQLPETNAASTPAAQNTPIKPLIYGAAFVAILLIATVLRGWDLTGADLWADEVYTQYRANATLEDSLESILKSGNQTPVYYMLMRLLPNDARLELRLPAFLLGLVNIALLIVMVRSLFDDAWLGLGAGLLLAVHPMHIILSRTARFYTLVMALGMGVSWLFLLILRRREDRRLWWAFGIISSIAYVTHFTVIGLAVVQGIVLGMLVLRDRETHMALLRRWIIVQMLAVIPLLIWSFAASQNGVNNAYLYGKHYPPLRELPITFGHLLVGYDGRWDWVMLPGLIVAALG
ncbi:MAG: glycosyltransferase family 39 protein, partial [Anaerolineae bacterium]|nr:glycosyltransferase family 39 protein [Anaerolineae bacterium]